MARKGDLDQLKEFGERYLSTDGEQAESSTETADAAATTVTQEMAVVGEGGQAGDGALLAVRDLRAGYGERPVLHGISFAVREGETAVLLGLNGAGKSTTALNLAGALRPTSGTITFDGQDATRWSAARAVAAGIVLVPEGRRVFPDLNVEKNLRVGAWSKRRHRDVVQQQLERVFGYFPRLEERRTQMAGTLSGGEQQMLAIGRGLMARPKLLIIDEASLGLAPVIVKDVFEIVRHINEDGTTVILIEQNVGALAVADVGLVMEQGRIVAEFRGDELEDPTRVREIFLG